MASVVALPVLPPAAAVSAGTTALADDMGDSFTGTDGQSYDKAPLVVETAGGNMFFGPDFDAACLFGAEWAGPMRRLTRLARVIEKSGRRVVWTGAPSKTSVVYPQLSLAEMPHGRCDRSGLRGLSRVVDTYEDPNYLPIRASLARSKHQVYWRTDPHWTTVGGSIWARAVAHKLDPKLGRQQRYTYGTETAVGLFNSSRDIDAPETLETAMPAGRVRTKTAAASVQQWEGYPQSVSDYAWTSRPAKLTWPGRTLVFGDSFTFYALPNLLPVFRHGRFMWLGTAQLDDVVAAIRDADTVVLEVYQTFLAISTELASKTFRQQVRDALR